MVSPLGRARSLTASWATATALALALVQTPIALAAAPDGATTSSTNSAPKTAILPLVVEGELPDADRDTLTAQLVEGLQRGNFAVVTPEEVAAVSGGDCSKAGCMQKIASSTGATHIVRAKVEVIDRDYTVSVELYDGSDGSQVVSSSDGCEICGVVDVGALLDAQAATLRTKLDALASGPAAVVVTSDPEGAEVMLDGEPFGVTPLDKPIVPGDHVIRVSKDGYIAVQEKRTFVEGARESLSYELEKTPNRLPKRPYGWASLALGIASTGAGVALITIHDDPNIPIKFGGECNGRTDAEGDCEFLFNTKWAGLGFSLAGGALVTLGVAILINTSKSPRKQAKVEAALEHLQLGPGGVGIKF